MGTTLSTERASDSLQEGSKDKKVNITSSAHASFTEDESSTSPDITGIKQNQRASAEKTPVRRNTARNNSGIANFPERIKTVASSHITDDQVHVNLAMADLMAYLQVVATNSQKLPMTRRDDPELQKTISSITSEEYARKSAAFIPSDVRVIAGSFTKYGRVWDLPTSEEYNANDGAQEPGRSHGGACCNSMLKVLYDAANDAADEENEAAASEGIFDEDDEESLMTNPEMGMGRTRTFESLVLGTVPCTITWATLLLKMKSEIHEIEYAQTPILTSTRKIDLSKPFSLVPECFDPKKNAMRSLLIGCNYTGTAGAELKASHDDVRSMKDYIVNVHGFPETKGLMTVLIDDDSHKPPSHLNIVESLKALAEESQPGDVIFIQLSGHGGRVLDSVKGSEAETYDEAFAPSDFQDSGLIRDVLIYKILLAPMRYGVTITMLIDTCDTGMIVDLPYVWSAKNDRRETSATMSRNDNFSFIRFLKVVKTLYESSSFTQLGNTVDTALRKPGDDAIEENSVAEGLINDNRSLVTKEKVEETLSPPAAQQGILCALAACTSRTDCNMNQDDNKDEKVRKAPSRDAQPTSNTSFLDHVMSCALGHNGEDYFSEDDDTLGTDTIGETTTYDSLTDDGYETHKGRRSRGRRR